MLVEKIERGRRILSLDCFSERGAGGVKTFRKVELGEDARKKDCYRRGPRYLINCLGGSKCR